MTTGCLAALGVVLILPGTAVAAAAGDSRDSRELQSTIVSESAFGTVVFPHEMHYEDMGLACEDCHHETNARRLEMPHADYFDDFWIPCFSCHHESSSPASPQACSACHDASHASIADETLSSKVVVHRSCWQCHEVDTGAEASRSCSSCHDLKPAVNDDGSEVAP